MQLKLICCEVFYREVCMALLESEHTVFPVFIPKMSHTYPDHMRELLQNEIDNTDFSAFDNIILGFGLCGNATAGLKARKLPLVIPRAHDCCTLFLGSKDIFEKHFGHRPSCRWTSGGYMGGDEDYLRNSGIHHLLGLDLTWQQLVEKYGEENAEYIRETLTPKDNSDEQIVYIQTPPYERFDFQQRVQEDALKSGRRFELLQGDMRLIQMLIRGIWPQDEFLIVPPGCTIEGVYDQHTVIRVSGPE